MQAGAEILCAAVEHPVGAPLAYPRELARAGGSGDLGALQRRELDRERPDPARGARHQHPRRPPTGGLPGSQPSPAVQRLQGRQPGEGDRGRLGRRDLVAPGRPGLLDQDSFSESAAAMREQGRDPVTGAERGHPGSDGEDTTGEVEAGHERHPTPRRGREVAAAQPEVGAVDAAGLDRHQYLCATRGPRAGTLLDPASPTRHRTPRRSRPALTGRYPPCRDGCDRTMRPASGRRPASCGRSSSSAARQGGSRRSGRRALPGAGGGRAHCAAARQRRGTRPRATPGVNGAAREVGR